MTRAGTLAVYGDGGQGGERTDEDDHKMEYGLLGITAAPDFAETGHIYLQYFPSFNPASTPPGPAGSRRDLEDVAAAHLALHDRPARRSSSTSTPRS